MPDRDLFHLALAAAPAAGLLTALFALRARSGIAPFYLALGAVQLLHATVLGLAAAGPGAGDLATAGGVLLPATLYGVTLVRLAEGAEEARRLVRGLVFVQLILAAAGGVVVPEPGGRGLAVREAPDLGVWLVLGVNALAVGVACTTLRETIHRASRLPPMRGVLALTAGFALVTGAAQVFVAATDLLWHRGPAREAAGVVVAAVVTAPVFGLAAFAVAGRLRRAAGAAGLVTYRERYEALRTAVDRDPLTGLYNRRFFDEALAREFDRAERTGLLLTLVLIDLDQFKAVNDRHGHQAGDRVLRVLAGVLRESVRGHDLPCRFGGDEFAVLLPAAGPATAAAVAERVRDGFRRACAADPSVPGVTLTVGYATFPGQATDPEGLFRAADRRLYRGKSAGRDRVVGSDSDVDLALPPEPPPGGDDPDAPPPMQLAY